MEVFAVTVFVSLLLGAVFAVLFAAERAGRGARGPEQAALLPLDDGPSSPPRRGRPLSPDNAASEP